MLGYMRFLFYLLFVSPLYAQLITVDVDYEVWDEVPSIVVRTKGERVSLQSYSLTPEDMSETLLEEKDRLIPHFSGNDAWCKIRDTRRRNLSLYHLYQVTSVKTKRVLGYIDLTSNLASQPIYEEESDDAAEFDNETSHEECSEVSSSMLKSAVRCRHASIIPLFESDVDVLDMQEAIGLAFNLVDILTNYFPLPEGEQVRLGVLPKDWELILANINFEAQRISAERGPLPVTTAFRQRLEDANQMFEILCRDRFGEENGAVNTIMPGETEDYADGVISYIPNESSLERVFAENGFSAYTDGPPEGYASEQFTLLYKHLF